MTKSAALVLAQARCFFHGYLSGASRDLGRELLWQVLAMGPADLEPEYLWAVFRDLGYGEDPIPPQTVDMLVEMTVAMLEAGIPRKRGKAAK